MKQRLLYFDNLKGFAILLVVLGHCIQFNGATGVWDLLFKVIYSFHMPLFMAVSGYFGYKKNVNYISESNKKFVRLMIPYLIFGGVGLLIHSTTPLSVILDPDSYLWFLWDLFFISLIANGVFALGLDKKLSFLLLTLLSFIFLSMGKFFPSNVCNIKSICWMFQFYVAGAMIKNYGTKILGNRITTICFLTIFIMCFYVRLHMVQDNLFSFVIKASTAYSAVLFLFSLFMSVFDIKTYLVYLGQITLGIYAVHQYVIKQLGIPNVLFSFFVALTISVLFVQLIRKTKYLKFIIGE